MYPQNTCTDILFDNATMAYQNGDIGIHGIHNNTYLMLIKMLNITSFKWRPLLF